MPGFETKTTITASFVIKLAILFFIGIITAALLLPLNYPQGIFN